MRKLAMFAALAGAALVPATAFAQFAQAPAGTTVDLSPIVNPLIQALGVIVTTMLVPLAWAGYRFLEKKWHLETLKIEENFRATIDKGAQAAIGAALSKIEVQPGRLQIDVKNQVIADAANKLAANFGDALDGLGVEDKANKAREIIESRLGLMEAAAAGAPVPNPSQPTVVVAPPAAPAAPPTT